MSCKKMERVVGRHSIVRDGHGEETELICGNVVELWLLGGFDELFQVIDRVRGIDLDREGLGQELVFADAKQGDLSGWGFSL